MLRDRIDESLRAFRPRVRQPGGEHYLFALEDTATREVIGVSGIAARIGGFEPWYGYEVREERHVHAPLGIDRGVPVLHLKVAHGGPSEVCSLFLRADRRRGGMGRLLSLARFLFMGAHPHRFMPTIIAEMRGYIDQTGHSPFWEAVGRHFFNFDFYRADVLSGLGEKQFIADLMPRHPIYVPLLPASVQAVLGRVHHDTEPALAMLLDEGFQMTTEVDIFDAGPLLRAEVSGLRTIRASRSVPVRGVIDALPPGNPTLLLAHCACEFRACLGGAIPHDDGSVTLAREVGLALNAEAGTTITISPLR
jgi:arginine N-succinyltransferase